MKILSILILLTVVLTPNVYANPADRDLVRNQEFQIHFDRYDIQKITEKFEGYAKKFKDVSITIFVALLIISVLLKFLRLVSSGEITRLSAVVDAFLWEILVAVMFFFLFVEQNRVIDFARSFFDDSSKSITGKTILDSISINAWFSNIEKLVSNFFNQAIGLDRSIKSIFVSFCFLIASLFFVLFTGASLFILIMIYLEATIVYLLSAFFVGLFGSPHTRNVSISFVWYCIGVSAQLYVAIVWQYSMLEIFQAMSIGANFSTVISVILISLFAYFGMSTIPAKVGQLFGGSADSNPIQRVASGMTMGISTIALSRGLNLAKQTGIGGIMGAGLVGSTAKQLQSTTKMNRGEALKTSAGAAVSGTVRGIAKSLTGQGGGLKSNIQEGVSQALNNAIENNSAQGN